jgi:hypothetical protein
MYVIIAAALLGVPVFPWEGSFVMMIVVIVLYLNVRVWARLVE